MWREIAQKRVSPQSPSHVGKEGWGLLGASWGKRCSLREGASPFFPHLPGSHSPSPNDSARWEARGNPNWGHRLAAHARLGSSAPAQPPAALTLGPRVQRQQGQPAPCAQANLTTTKGQGVTFPKQLRAAPKPCTWVPLTAPKLCPLRGWAHAPKGASPPSLGKHRWEGAGVRAGGASGVSNQETKPKGQTRPQRARSHAAGPGRLAYGARPFSGVASVWAQTSRPPSPELQQWPGWGVRGGHGRREPECVHTLKGWCGARGPQRKLGLG